MDRLDNNKMTHGIGWPGPIVYVLRPLALSLLAAVLAACSAPVVNDCDCLAAPTTRASTTRPAGPLGLVQPDGKWFINDAAVESRLVSETLRLARAKQTASLAELREQSRRPGCNVATAPAGRTRLSPAEVYRDRLAGVLIVGNVYKCPKCPNWHAACAGGVAIAPNGVFVTNHHVVQKDWGADQVMVVMTRHGQVFPVREVLAGSAVNDVVVARAEIGQEAWTPLPLSADAAVGAPVTVISHPESRWYTLTQGVVSRFYLERGRGPGVKRLAITADFAKGSSGCPLFDECGNVIGIVSSTHSVYYDTTTTQPANLQMVFKQCIPAEAILALIGARATMF